MKDLKNNNKPVEKINISSYFYDYYDKSDLQKICRTNPLPHKCTIDGQEFYYYNADLSGLMWLQAEDKKLIYNDYIDIYRKGFAEGLNHLESKEDIKRKDFYKSNKIEELKRVLHSFIYVRKFPNYYKGLIDFINKTQFIWTEDNIYNQGYYNGFLHSILTLCSELTIEVFENEEPPETIKIGDFFPNLEQNQILRIQEEFSKCRGIEMACFIHQMNEDGKLKIIKNTQKSFKDFLIMFGDIPTEKHEAVRKCFEPAITKGDFRLSDKNQLKRFDTKKKIDDALKVG